VRRERSGADRRRVSLSLSARGNRLVRRAPDAPQERLVRGIEQLSVVRRRALASTLGELALAVDAVDRAPAMFFEDGRRRSTGSARA
jgi:hypothetical protein